MQKIKNHKNGFTLVELIIVITILAILASISFVGYSGYLADARDSTRLSSIKNIGTKLEIYQTQIGTYPNPDNEIKITSSGNIISYQGEYTSNIGGKIGADGFSDPLDGSNLLYGVKSDKKSYQLLGYAEKILGLSLNSQTYADSGDKSEMGIISGGNKLGILLDDKNIGVNYLGSDVDIYNTTTTYNYVFGERDKVSGTGGVLVENIPNKSCKTLKALGYNIDGIYKINPDGSEEFRVYCDMNTDGGGWTLLLNYDNTLSTTDLLSPSFSECLIDDYNCLSNAYSKLKMTEGIMIDGSQSKMTSKDDYMTRLIIYSDLLKYSLDYIYNTPGAASSGAWNIGKVDKVLKSYEGMYFDCGTVVSCGADYNSLITKAENIYLRDYFRIGDNFLFGKSGGNLSGWPQNVYGSHWHNNYRMWGR